MEGKKFCPGTCWKSEQRWKMASMESKMHFINIFKNFADQKKLQIWAPLPICWHLCTFPESHQLQRHQCVRLRHNPKWVRLSCLHRFVKFVRNWLHSVEAEWSKICKSFKKEEKAVSLQTKRGKKSKKVQNFNWLYSSHGPCRIAAAMASRNLDQCRWFRQFASSICWHPKHCPYCCLHFAVMKKIHCATKTKLSAKRQAGNFCVFG